MFLSRIILGLFIVTLWGASPARAQEQGAPVKASSFMLSPNLTLNTAYASGNLESNTTRRASRNEISTKLLGAKTLNADTGIIYKPNRLALELLGDYSQTKFENKSQMDAGAITRDDRDAQVIKGTIRASYDTETGWTPYIETTFGRDNFINERVSAPNRNNNLFRLLAGSSFNYKGIVYGFFGVGMDRRSYSDKRIASTDGLALESKISWEPHPKSKFTFDVSRESFEDNDLIAGITQTETGLEYRHELKQNLFLNLIGSYNSEDFNDSPRQDDTIATGIGVQYIISPKFQLGADYNYMTRDSNMNGLDFDNNTLMLRAKMKW